jgi:hypothetical protein
LKNAHLPRKTQDFSAPRKRDFAKLNLHLGIFEQPAKALFQKIMKKSNCLYIKSQYKACQAKIGLLLSRKLSFLLPIEGPSEL